METKHTPGPWHATDSIMDEYTAIVSPRSLGIASTYKQDERKADAARIVACVNACEGIENPADLRQQRDELLAALVLLYPIASAMNAPTGLWTKQLDQARAAIAKARA